jgi:hypothetical protein
MDDKLAAELKEAEAAVAKAEKELGANHPDLADKLTRYASLLRKTEKRTLDAVNVEARARAIRAKLLAADEAARGDKPSTTAAKPTAKQQKMAQGMAIGMYLGFVALLFAVASLVANQTFMPALLIVAVLLSLCDIVMSRSGFWRASVVVALGLSAWWCNSAVPSSMLVDESPINRFNYASENPDLVQNIRKLGQPVNVLNYRICVPPGFNPTADEIKDWGRVLTFAAAGAAADAASGAPASVAAPDQSSSEAPASGQLRFMVMRFPEGITGKSARASLLKLARDVVMPRLGKLSNWQDIRQEDPHFEEINGTGFAKISFGVTGAGLPISGFAYVAPLKSSFLVISGTDLAAASDASMPLMDAAVYTMKRVASAEPELE